MAGRGINKVTLIGNLGADPDVRYMQNGDPVANISLATSEFWKDRTTGDQQERTEWHKVVIFGKLAEIARQYLRKGSQVYIEGKLRTRKWQTQDGQERYSTEIVIDINGTMMMLGGRQDSGNMAAANPQFSDENPYEGRSNYRPSAPTTTPNTSASFNSFDDDIPF